MSRRITSDSSEETRSAGRRWGEGLDPGAVVGLTGPLGSGKTVFVQGIAEALGIEEPVTSPTYTLIAEYSGRLPLYHMDLYRLDTPEEFSWLGADEMLYGEGVKITQDMIPDVAKQPEVMAAAERAGKLLGERLRSGHDRMAVTQKVQEIMMSQFASST